MNNTRNGSFSWKARARSFKYAWAGLMTLVIHEHNARIHLCAALLAILLSWLLSISANEWCLVVLCIAGVIMAEGFNTALESLCDKCSPEIHPLAKKAKDVAAASVLIMALAALVVGILIFLPKIWSLI